MANTDGLIQTFICLGCNALFLGLTRDSTKNVEMVQNAAAKVLVRIRLFDHITPIIASLHWLPIHIRSDFKVLLTSVARGPYKDK